MLYNGIKIREIKDIMRKKMTGSHISKLMEVFGVSGKELADAIHVDYSLISKWRLLKRRLPLSSPHTRRIADYFMSLDLQTGYARIKKLLHTSYPETPMETKKKIEVLLCKWLSHVDLPENAHVFTPSGNARPETCYVYDGNEGRRQALLDFLEYVMLLPDGQEIVMCSTKICSG